MSQILILRLIHILCGVFWAGTLMFFAVFLEPIMRGAGPEGGRMMQRIAGSKYPLAMTVLAILTIGSGLWMYQIVSSGTPGWTHSHFGIVLTAGATSGLIAFLIGLTVTRPNAARMAELGKAVIAGGGQPTEGQLAQIASVRTRLVLSTRAVALFLGLAVAAMATARYA